MKSLKYIFTLLTIALMCTIFFFSSQPAEKSSEISSNVGYIIGRIIVPDFDLMTPEEQYLYADSIDYYVRKTAHAAEYLLLSVLCSITLYLYFRECPYLVFFLGWLITVLFAESDEIHQLYVPGRAGMLTDVFIDASGAAAGILLTIISFLLSRKIKGIQTF